MTHWYDEQPHPPQPHTQHSMTFHLLNNNKIIVCSRDTVLRYCKMNEASGVKKKNKKRRKGRGGRNAEISSDQQNQAPKVWVYLGGII